MNAPAAPPTDPPLPDDRDSVIAELEHLRSTIDAADRARERRREVWQAGRRLEPPVPVTHMAAASGVSDAMIHKDLREKPAR